MQIKSEDIPQMRLRLQFEQVDTEELKEINDQANIYASKNAKFKIDSMITQNIKQVELDFIH